MMNITPVVKQLIIINVIFFIGSQLLHNGLAYELFSLHYPESDKFRIWQPITHMFMHAPLPNFTHIFFNMYGLYIFGSPLEHFWGPKRFLLFYFVSGIGAAALQLAINYYQIHEALNLVSNLNLSASDLHQILNIDMVKDNYFSTELFETGIRSVLHNSNKEALLNKENCEILYQSAVQVNSTMVGASGAIYGLLTAFAFMLPNAELMLFFIPYPIKAKYFVPALVAMDFFSGVTGFSILGGGVAHFAHVGGALTGFILMIIWRNRKFKHNRWN